MKKYIVIVAVLFALLGTSCKQSFLELQDPTKIATKDLFTSAQNVGAAVTGVYNQLLGIYNNYYVFGEIASDNAYVGFSQSGQSSFTIFSVDPSNPVIQTFWSDSYKCISKANTVIVNTPKVQMDDALKGRYIGEMKFIRALAYFNLVRLFGDVPLITEDLLTDNYQNAYTYGRTPSIQVYAQIIKDLTDAESVLPASYPAADAGRPTGGAVKALLGKIYLTQKNYSAASSKLGELIPGTATAGNLAGSFGLLTNYSDIFSVTNEINQEIIFSARYISGGLGLGSSLAGNFLPAYSGTEIISKGLSGGILMRKDLYEHYTADDARAGTARAYYAKGGQSDYYTRKYIVNGAPFAQSDNDNDWIVIRYADVLLMYAEAVNEQADPTTAHTYVNQVRTRAHLPGLTGLNQSNLRVEIENERRLEFSFEGHRWFDLARTGRLIDVMNAFFLKYSAIPSTLEKPNNGLFLNTGGSVVQVQSHQVLYPIPTAEIQYNPSKMKQNPGYTGN